MPSSEIIGLMLTKGFEGQITTASAFCKAKITACEAYAFSIP